MDLTDTISLVLPTFSFGTLAVPATAGCGSTTFTATGTNSGTATATLTLQVTSAILVAEAECVVAVMSGVTTGPAPQAQNIAVRTSAVMLTQANDIAAIAIASSTATVYPVPVFEQNLLTILNPITGAPSSISYSVTLNVPFAVADTLKLVLPGFTFGTISVPSLSGCGTTTFAVTNMDSGLPSATLTLTGATATLVAHQSCKITIASGVTTSTVAQAVDLASRTVEVSLSCC